MLSITSLPYKDMNIFRQRRHDVNISDGGLKQYSLHVSFCVYLESVSIQYMHV